MSRAKKKTATKSSKTVKARRALNKSSAKSRSKPKSIVAAELPKRRTTSVVPEVTNITKHGFWLLLRRSEYFIPYLDFPVFKKAPFEKLIKVKEYSRRKLHWPDLDVKIALKSLVQPDRHPWMDKISLADLQAAADPNNRNRPAQTSSSPPRKIDIHRN